MIDLQLLGGLAVTTADRSPTSAAPGRRALALLAVVAASPQPIARDKLLALLWPESDLTRARNSLRQSLFALRRDVSEDLFLPETRNDLQLDPAHVRVDLWAFRDALARNAPAEAVAAYRGALLDGFHIAGLSQFSQWAETERQRLERQYIGALDRLAQCAEHERRYEDAVMWRRVQAEADRLSGRAALSLIRALAAAGDRAGALKYAEQHERLIRQELEVEPDPVVTEFVMVLRREGATAEVHWPSGAYELIPYVEKPLVAAGHEIVSSPSNATPSARRRWFTPPVWLVGSVAAVLVGSAMAGVLAAGSAAPSVVILASGAHPVANRDPANQLVACVGPACPTGKLPQAAYVVPPNESYSPPSSGSAYIAPVADATTIPAPGYRCCTRATFENTFRLPPDAISATITLTTLADNAAAVGINGVEFGRQADSLSTGNFTADGARFVATFAPDPSGINRLRVTLFDAGGALGVQYLATVTYETAAERRKEATKGSK